MMEFLFSRSRSEAIGSQKTFVKCPNTYFSNMRSCYTIIANKKNLWSLIFWTLCFNVIVIPSISIKKYLNITFDPPKLIRKSYNLSICKFVVASWERNALKLSRDEYNFTHITDFKEFMVDCLTAEVTKQRGLFCNSDSCFPLKSTGQRFFLWRI